MFSISYADDAILNLMHNFSREIPVELFDGGQTTIGVRGEAILECYRGVKLSEIYYFGGNIHIQYLDNGLQVSDDDDIISIGLAQVRLKPRLESSLLLYNNRAYRGYLRADYGTPPDSVILLNIVDIEEYLKGVLPGEIGDRTGDEYEAVKAQAIAARTYAVWKMTDRATSKRLSSTIADQLYTGHDSEKELLNKAIDETAGEIMVYKSHPIAAYYHAVCGGHTAPVEKIWAEKRPTPYLSGAPDDEFCSWAKSYSWNETFSSAKLKEAFEKYFGERGRLPVGVFDHIRDITFNRDSQTGRVDAIKIITPAGVYTERCDRIRWVLGRPSVPGAILPSTHFNYAKETSGDTLISLQISGTGNGHGVGMCQCGAIGRSRAGYKFNEILEHYYSHIKIVKIY